MNHKSPLFVSALELVVHATELFQQGNQRKYKFVVLHLANAVELILKDRLLLAGVSIYKTDKKRETVSVWQAFEALEHRNIKVIERPSIELLIDDRNTIQHRFGFPDASTVCYYLEHVIAFFKRFLDAEYNVDLVAELGFYLSEEDRKLLELIVEKDEAAYLPKLFQVSPEGAVRRLRDATWTEIEEIIKPAAVHPSLVLPHCLTVVDHLEQEGWLSEGASKKILQWHTESAEEFEDRMKLLRELKQCRQTGHIPEIEGITIKPPSNTNESRDSDEAGL